MVLSRHMFVGRNGRFFWTILYCTTCASFIQITCLHFSGELKGYMEVKGIPTSTQWQRYTFLKRDLSEDIFLKFDLIDVSSVVQYGYGDPENSLEELVYPKDGNRSHYLTKNILDQYYHLNEAKSKGYFEDFRNGHVLDQ